MSLNALSVPPAPIKFSSVYLHQEQSQHDRIKAVSHLDHVCQLDIDQVPAYVRQTNIVCTLGESWDSKEGLEKMIKNGMNILRLNINMGSRQYFKEVISRVREIEKENNYVHVVAIALDLTAPPARTGLINGDPDGVLTLKDGQIVGLTTDAKFQSNSSVDNLWIDVTYFPKLMHTIRRGDRIFLDDGDIHLIVRDIEMDRITCLVEQGGDLGSSKRVQIPRERFFGRSLGLGYLSDLQFATECEVDFVFTSFALSAEQILQARNILGNSIKLFAKIETKEAFNNLEDLIVVSDGIIIGRGDLGLEIRPDLIFAAQKRIIACCNVKQKPVFVITQLLESMSFKPRPTRAEVSDVANAVLDGADGLILTVETSKGLYPLHALRSMHQICREAEAAIFHEQLRSDLKRAREFQGMHITDPMQTAAHAAVEAACRAHASAIFVVTSTGNSAAKIASCRPSCPVVAVIRSIEMARQCHSVRGVHPFLYHGKVSADWADEMDARLNAALQIARSRGFVKEGDQIVIVTGWASGHSSTNTVRVHQVPKAETKLQVVCSSSCLTSR